MKRKLKKHLLVGVASLALLLAACAQGPVSSVAQPARYDYTVTVQVAASDTQSAIEAKYNLPVVIWQPDSGYAMLGVQTEQVSGLGALSGSLDENKDAFSVAETNARAAAFGLSSWQEGGQAWGGGGQAWGGGGQAWGGGGQAWGGGIPDNVTLNANNAFWSRIRLSQAFTLAPKRGNGITIAVIDSGIDLEHPAFRNRLVHPSQMWDWVGNDAVPQEVAGGSNEGFGHGTVVAGIIAQVSPNSRLMPLRVLDSEGKGDTTNVIAAINWAVAKGAQVINLSLGAESEKPLQQALQDAAKAGVMIVASAGNDGAEKLVFPANRGRSGSLGELMLNVGSSDGGDRLSRFSNRGKELEILAPGEKVYGPVPGNRMAAWSGTSMAAPIVTSALALAIAERSYTDLKNLTKTLTDNSDDVSGNNPEIKRDQLGSGRLNLERFLQAAHLLK